MSTREKQFAIIEVYDRPPAGAIAVGSMSAVTESIIGSKSYNEAAARAVRIQAQAVDAQERCDDAERRRDQALEEQRQAQAVVDAARASLINQLCERADALGRRMDKFERKRVRNYLDALPDPDAPDQDHPTHSPSGELHSIGPAERRDPGYFDPDDSADAHDQIPEPKDPSGTTLEL
jgi:hypothetical protein